MTESGDRALSASAKVRLASCASGRVAPTPGNSACSAARHVTPSRNFAPAADDRYR